MGYKRKKRDENDYVYDPAPKHLQVGHIKNQEKRLIIILEDAQLESVKVRLCFSPFFISTNFISQIFIKSEINLPFIIINYFLVTNLIL